MKKLLVLMLALTVSYANRAAAQTAKKDQQVTLVCKIIGEQVNAQTIFLYEQLGLGYRVVAQGQRQADESYLIQIPASEPRLYSVGFNDAQNGRIILGTEKELTLWANLEFMEKGRTIGSDLNKAFETMQNRVTSLAETSEELRNNMRRARATQSAESIQQVSAALAAHENEKTTYLESLKKQNALLWRCASLQLAPERIADQQNNAGELEFYAKSFFDYADLNNPAFENIPQVFDAFQKYALMLNQLGANQETSKKMLDEQLAKLKPGTKTHRRALSGVIEALKSTNHPNYPEYGQLYIKLYKPDDLGDVRSLEYDLNRSSTFTPGTVAPDLVGNTPAGDVYSLSKMRGKYVLIDFWASWCGPCRRENPNVVALYGKYKDKGFDILGVSLDRTKEAWEKAIEQDGLTWHHISDLQGWKSEHAALYSVTSIPQTLLIDPQGKIIQRNLRGEQLGMKLQEIFGE